MTEHKVPSSCDLSISGNSGASATPERPESGNPGASQAQNYVKDAVELFCLSLVDSLTSLSRLQQSRAKTMILIALHEVEFGAENSSSLDNSLNLSSAGSESSRHSEWNTSPRRRTLLLEFCADAEVSEQEGSVLGQD